MKKNVISLIVIGSGITALFYIYDTLWIIEPNTHNKVNYDFSDVVYKNQKINDVIISLAFQTESFFINKYSCTVWAASPTNKYKKFTVKGYKLTKGEKVLFEKDNIENGYHFNKAVNRNYYSSGIRIFEDKRFWISKETKLELEIDVGLVSNDDQRFTGAVRFPLKVIDKKSKEWRFPIR